MKNPAQTANLGPAHKYLGHFGKAAHLNNGHAKTGIIPAVPGHKAITFKKGGLHDSTDTPLDKPIPAAKKAAAAAGKYGPKAKKQALFAANVLTGPK